MLTRLRIDNFALIDQATIDFNGGFTVITGETGSGKSILLNALNLILGERANFGGIGTRKDKSIVEAEIDITDFGLQSFFESNELDYENCAIVRREINTQGRSRAFINDIPVQLNVLKKFTSRLIHIHSQYNTLELKDVSFQMEVLDILAGTIEMRRQCTSLYNDLTSAKNQLVELENRYASESALLDYNQFQLEELSTLNLKELNYEALVSEQKEALNADELKMAWAMLISGLTDSNGPIDVIQRLNQSMTKSERFSPLISELNARLQSVHIELKDIADTAEGNLEKVDIQPERQAELTQIIDNYNKILFKHRLKTQDDLVALQDELAGTTASTENLSAEIDALKIEIEAKRGELNSIAMKLHDKREKAVPDIEKSIQNALAELKLNDTRLLFKLNLTEEFSKSGRSKLEMLFSPNKGFAPVPIHQAASGGELSRLMLSLQNLISKRIKLQTIFFDEIDTGVSGDVAQKIGNTLKKMGESMQVIAITHLPQVAAKGGQHLRVIKSDDGEVTKTQVLELTQNERVEEIARLMSGDEIKEAAISNAKALMAE